MATWLERFTEPRVIRARGVVEHVACRDAASGERRLVIASADAKLGGMLDGIAALHRELRNAHIPAFEHRGSAGGTEYVALRSSAVVDIESLMPIAMASNHLSPAATVAFLYEVIEPIRAAHATRDPRTGTGAPVCIGAFAGTNILVTDAGHIDVIGWGYPITDAQRNLLMRDATVMHIAWEAAFGAAATPHADLDAVGRYFHSLLPAAALPPEVVRALVGEPDHPRVAELIRLIAALEHAAHAREPAERSWDVYLDSLRRITALLGVAPDATALERELAAICARWRASTHVRVARDGSWVALRSGERIELERRPNLRGVVAALAAHRRDAPGAPVLVPQLLAAGWPGERIGEDAGRNRVRVAVSTLRSLGLRDLLLSRDDGYLFDPDVPLSTD